MADEIIRKKDYFETEQFDCSSAFLLSQLAIRAEYWSKLTDGSYSVPTGETGQIYEMAIAAHLKGSENLYWRDLVIGEAVNEGDRFYNGHTNEWVIVESEDLPIETVTKTSFPFQRLITK